MESKKNRTGPSWTACKKVLRSWPRPGVIALLHELYKLDATNRRFLHARLLAQHNDETLQDAQRALKALLQPSHLFRHNLEHNRLKRIIDSFEKSVSDPGLVARLLVIDLSLSSHALEEIGDYVELVDHMYSSLNRLEKCFEATSAAERTPAVDHLLRVAKAYPNFGHGISDEMLGSAFHWKERENAAAPRPEQDRQQDDDFDADTHAETSGHEP